MAGTTALDQLKSGIHLICAINCKIDALNCIKALERNAELSCQHLALEGGGDTHHIAEFTALELGSEGLNH